jgi:hypothetical protein
MKQRDLQDAEARRFTVLRSRYYGGSRALEGPRAITKFLAFYIAAEQSGRHWRYRRFDQSRSLLGDAAGQQSFLDRP